jgi:hypothetical protein
MRVAHGRVAASFKVTVVVFEPVQPTLENIRLTGSRRWKLCSLERSLTVILYVPRLSVATRAEPFFRLIVCPGPTVAVSLTGAAEVEPASASAVAARAMRAVRRSTSISFRLADCVVLAAPCPPLCGVAMRPGMICPEAYQVFARLTFCWVSRGRSPLCRGRRIPGARG